MEKPKRSNKINKILMIFLLLVLFPTGSYSIQKRDNIPSQVIVGGELLEVNVNTSKLMYYSRNYNDTEFENFDLIEKIEGQAVKNAFNRNSLTNIKRQDILKICLNMKSNEKVKVTLIRKNEKKNISLNKKELNHSYFMEYVPFSASLTYINPTDKSFGAVGHNVNIDNRENILTKDGEIYLCNLSEVKKSTKNSVGNMQGERIYNSQGKINKTSEFGVKGTIVGTEIYKNNDMYEVAKASEVKIGSAQLLIRDNLNEDKKAYEIKITKVNKQKKPEIQGFEFEVVDKDLIKNYGAIVQGMSGCPIIQNGKLIGALSHVTCNDTTKGMGVYIQWMMEN